jgi:hypothetical protein
MRIVAIFLCSLLALGVLSPGVSAQVRLSEILADPATDWDHDGTVSTKADEWVEIANMGSSSVDLASYRLADASAGFDWRFGFAGTLAPGEVRVVYGSDAVGWESGNGFPALGLSLNNAGDTVFLYDTAGGDTVVVDQYTYAAFEVLDDRAAGRLPDAAGTWAVFDSLNPYGGTTPPLGTGCAPSPGAYNDCVPALPTEESTWGAIKSLFAD